MSNVKEHPLQHVIKDRYTYKDGHLFHNHTRGRSIKGNKAGGLHHTGYINVSVLGRLYRGHRLIWIYHNAENPIDDIDHIDGNKANNKIENLRVLSRSQNLHNKPNVLPRYKGRCVGVCWIPARNNWKVSICINYNVIVIENAETDYFEGCCKRKSAEARYHDEIYGESNKISKVYKLENL